MGVQVRSGRGVDCHLAHPDARTGQAEVRPPERNARTGPEMTTAAMVVYAYGQID